MKATYLLVDLFTILVPFAFSFHPKIKFHKVFIPFAKANLLAAVLFLTWDAFFTYKGVWSFNEQYISGIHLMNLPVEEVLFFVCIPFACVFTFHCSYLLFNVNGKGKGFSISIDLFILLLFITGIIFLQKAYTAATFISTSILLFVLKHYFKVNWLGQFFAVYPFLLIPFFIVNGILTGTGPDQPVVLYNDAENLNIRLATIPLEDVFYGMELLLLNIFLFQKFKTEG